MNSQSHCALIFRAGPDGGFTLMELLAAIGVVAILAALIFPAVGGMKEKANLAKCSSNLRQLGVGFQLYLNDHDGYLPQQAEVVTDINTQWQELVSPYLVGDRVLWGNQRNALRKDLACPGEKIPGGIVFGQNLYLRAEHLQGDGSYQINNNAPKKLAGISAKHSDFALLAENYTGDFWDTKPKADPRSSGVTYLRHKVGGEGMANFLFADFHVEALSYQQTLDRPVITYPAVQ